MTRWGILLLVIYLGLGLSQIDLRQAARYAVWATVATLVLVGIQVGIF